MTVPLVAVGSINPVKVGAARRIFTEAFPDAEVFGIAVPSGVSDQPIGEAETMQGALNRARAAQAATGSDWGVGLEGGVTFEGDHCWMIQFGAVVHRGGRTSAVQGVRFLLPPSVGQAVREGGEVGPLFDQISGQTDTKKKGGAIGFLTRGLVVREEMYAHIVAAALVPFFHPELYEA